LREIIVDSFAGGGGASTGIEWALGRSPDIAINHDPEAIAMHTANHPATEHYCEDVWKVDPRQATRGRPVGLMWLSPDCKHFSKAKGGKPVSKKIRGLAWLAVHWAKTVRPRVICLENVEEFADWGPVLEDGRPCPMRKGFTFRRFVSMLSNLGYMVDWRELKACDYGAPTIRKRLFLIARCDGLPIIWPEPTHGRGLLPYRTAAECIEWSIPCHSIFLSKEEGARVGVKRPLVEATLRRVARGVIRYTIEDADPFIVPVNHAGDDRVHSMREPLRTITGQCRGEHALVTPFLAGVGGRAGQSPERSVASPYHTSTSKADKVLVAPTLIQTGYGERRGQAPRVPGLDKPIGTLMAQGQKHALVTAFLARHYGGHENDGAPLQQSMFTVTAKDHHALVASSLVKLKGTCRDGQPVTEPLHTIQAGGFHYAEVRAFLLKYYTSQQSGHDLRKPIDTITTEDRFGLVTVRGEEYTIADIGMRILTPRELFRAQGFPDSYIIDPIVKGKPLTKTAQVRMVGNSVCPHVAAALIRANVGAQLEERAA
jgi:DNA (cytosine-5)-methyltransferase 1